MLRRLADNFTSAATAADWNRLELAARGLEAQLKSLAARGRWSDAELVALAQLRRAHDGAAAVCAAAGAALQARMDDLLANKEGQMAYALGDLIEPAGY